LNDSKFKQPSSSIFSSCPHAFSYSSHYQLPWRIFYHELCMNSYAIMVPIRAMVWNFHLRLSNLQGQVTLKWKPWPFGQRKCNYKPAKLTRYKLLSSLLRYNFFFQSLFYPPDFWCISENVIILIM